MFKNADRIWLKGLTKEINIQARFNAEFVIPENARLYITGATFYKVYLDGALIHHGPAPTATGFARVDVVDLPKSAGKRMLSIEVAGYACNSYAAVNQESYIIAEVVSEGEVVAYTGRDFIAYRVASHEQKTLRYSGQRHFSEIWNLSLRDEEHEIEILSNSITYLERRAPMPTLEKEWQYTAFCKGKFTLPADFDEKNLDKASAIQSKPSYYRTIFPVEEIKKFPTSFIAAADYNIREDRCEMPSVMSEGEFAVFECERNSSGIIHLNYIAPRGARIIIAFDELYTDGRFPNRMNISNAVEVTGEGDISFENFEIYGFKYYAVFVASGEIEIKDIYKIKVYHAPGNIPALNTDDEELLEIYEAALESYRSNSLGIFTDCPTRERAGWLCDSYYISRGSYKITGNTLIEQDFLENFIIHGCKDIPAGMLPMCYPAEHPSGMFIPQWSLWFILELLEYLERNPSADKAVFRDTVDGLLGFFKKYENEYLLLEDLPKWNFVEWSKANDWCEGVNFPTNMLYAAALEAVYKLYGDEKLAEKAAKIRNTVCEMSFDGKFFHDQALRTGGKLTVNEHISETCQYYAFYFGTADTDKYAELKERLLTEFGSKSEKYPEIEKANAFMGICLRMDLLLAWEKREMLIEEIKGYFLHMARLTGTLWEHRDIAASLNHGFPSYVAALLLKLFEK